MPLLDTFNVPNQERGEKERGREGERERERGRGRGRERREGEREGEGEGEGKRDVFNGIQSVVVTFVAALCTYYY